MNSIDRPMTYVVTFGEGMPQTLFVKSVQWSYFPEERGGIWSVFLDHGDFVRELLTPEVTETQTGIKFTTINGNEVDVRDPYESDVVDAGLSTYSWPLPMIYTVLRGEDGMSFADQLETYALVNPQGHVMTLVTMGGDAGVYARYASMWHRVANLETLDGGTLVQVEPDISVELYDDADNSGMSMFVKDLPVINPLEAEDAVKSGTMPLVSSGEVYLPVISSIDDVQFAIAVADRDESIRWFVEKRARALDPEVTFPWQ